MDSASQSQARGLKRSWNFINVLEFVLEAALGVKIYLGVRKVAQHLFLLLPLQEGAQSFGLPQVLKPLLEN